MKTPIAILTSDWHIWGRPTLWRSAEPDWFKAMSRPLRQIRKYQSENNDIPVLVAGDIFDFYNPPPETINWLIKNMPKNVYAIPGQHDLQNHVYELIEKTGFWTLVKAGVVHFLDPKEVNVIESPSMKMNVFSKPWETRVLTPQKDPLNNHRPILYIAHEYIYKDAESSFKDADRKANIKESKELLSQCDIAVYGDNHFPFISKVGGCKVVNCGTLMKRKIDERGYEIGFVVLYNDLTLERIPFSTDHDKYASITVENHNIEEQDKLASELLRELEELDTISNDFESEIMKYLSEKNYSRTIITNMVEIFTKYKETIK